jgi:hypothetical protein
MTNYLETGFLTFGHECEAYHEFWSDYRLQQHLASMPELSGCKVIGDGTEGIKVEVIFPPMADCAFTWQKYKEVFAVMRAANCKVSLTPNIRSQLSHCYINRAGGHVHIGTYKIMGISKDEFSRWSWDNFFNNGNVVNAHDVQMPFELIKDVIYRYANDHRFIDSMLPKYRRYDASDYSRSRNGMIKSIARYASGFRACDDEHAMARIINGTMKYHTVNIQPLLDNDGTIEFRQHHATLNMGKLRNWIRVLLNMFHYSDNERLQYGDSQTIAQHTTPSENPYRARTLKHTIWNCINTQGGMPSRDIMRIASVADINLRARITEIRNLFQSDDIIRTITQQEYGHQYGSSNGRHDLGGYELQSQYTLRNGQTSQSITVNYDADASVLAGLSLDRIQYWHQQIIDRR